MKHHALRRLIVQYITHRIKYIAITHHISHITQNTSYIQEPTCITFKFSFYFRDHTNWLMWSRIPSIRSHTNTSHNAPHPSCNQKHQQNIFSCSLFFLIIVCPGCQRLLIILPSNLLSKLPKALDFFVQDFDKNI